ncbi:TetR/AcrR family transcriptional regulator [Methylovulum psychrotolerans]|uniref:TetR/AcrR family transcriptional regulator n=1 Tax=Methylovulum psychrotolerans TaxID=1704499 RepID=A0A2S5CNM1_9GAMM|nr:TetR/AcrR family transcriptional regulator [Methylovulum psychrotolerans]POZ52357.1 TetR/AcrR family transcriptional regulator [Methylovulum psychrotolerans]
MIKCGRPRKGEETLSRDRLVDSASQLFLEYGYGNLCLETVAKEARVSMRTIYSQFGGKAGLFGAVIKRCSDRFVTVLAENNVLEGQPEAALLDFAKHFLYGITRPDAVRLRTILLGEALRFPDLATQFYEQGPGRTQVHLAQFFARQQQAGHFLGTDPQVLADYFLGAFRSERFQKLQLGLATTPDEAEIEAWARQTTTLFLYGSLKAGVDGNGNKAGMDEERGGKK